jgi:hypothetical protein
MGRKFRIPYYRPTFVEKTIGEVGDGTAWPMEASVAQIAAVCFRVRKSEIAGFSYAVGSGVGLVNYHYGNPGPQVDNAKIYVESDFEIYHSDAASFTNSSEATIIAILALFNETDFYSPPYEVVSPGGLFSSSWTADPIDEIAIFDNMSRINGFPAMGPCVYSSSHPNHGALPWLPPAIGPYIAVGLSPSFRRGNLRCAFSGEVAWIDIMGNGDPFDPGNSRYLGFYIDNRGGDLSDYNAFSTDYTGALAGTYTFEFGAIGLPDLTCNLYFNPFVSTPTSSVNVTHYATEWWPYAHENGSPFWNRFDGTRLP